MNPTHAADCDYLDKLRRDLDALIGSGLDPRIIASLCTRTKRLLQIVEALSAAVEDEAVRDTLLCDEIVKWRKERI